MGVYSQIRFSQTSCVLRLFYLALVIGKTCICRTLRLDFSLARDGMVRILTESAGLGVDLVQGRKWMLRLSGPHEGIHVQIGHFRCVVVH